jgi:hypothetical protein
VLAEILLLGIEEMFFLTAFRREALASGMQKRKQFARSNGEPRLSRSGTQIHILEIEKKVFAETAERLEQLPPDE